MVQMMTSEILTVPEERLEDVIEVIRAGLKTTKVPKDVKYNLSKWCRDEEDYLKRLKAK